MQISFSSCTAFSHFGIGCTSHGAFCMKNSYSRRTAYAISTTRVLQKARVDGIASDVSLPTNFYLANFHRKIVIISSTKMAKQIRLTMLGLPRISTDWKKSRYSGRKPCLPAKIRCQLRFRNQLIEETEKGITNEHTFSVLAWHVVFPRTWHIPPDHRLPSALTSAFSMKFRMKGAARSTWIQNTYMTFYMLDSNYNRETTTKWVHTANCSHFRFCIVHRSTWCHDLGCILLIECVPVWRNVYYLIATLLSRCK